MTPERLKRIEELVEYPTYSHGLVTELIKAVRETHELYRELKRCTERTQLRTRAAVTLGAGSYTVESSYEVETVGDVAERLAEAIKAA